MRHRRLRSALALLIAAGAVAWPAAQSGKHAITHEDVWLMKRLGTPAVSPDGKWAVLPVTEPAYDPMSQSTDLWMVPTDGSAPPRRLTNTRGAESGVTWSPDGTRLAFAAPVSDGPLSPGSLNALAAQVGRPGGGSGQQIFVLDVAGGGDPTHVTDVSTGARMPVWRPDGKAILFNSDVYPGATTDAENQQAMADRHARKWNARVYDSFPVRDWDRWLDDRRPSLLVQELSPGAAARDILATATIAAAGPAMRVKKGDRLATLPGFGGQMGSGSESIAASWAPDGSGRGVHGDGEPARGGLCRRRPDAVDAGPRERQRAAGAAAAVLQRPQVERRRRLGDLREGGAAERSHLQPLPAVARVA